MKMSRNDNASLELESESDSVRMMIVRYPSTHTHCYLYRLSRVQVRPTVFAVLSCRADADAAFRTYIRHLLPSVTTNIVTTT